MLYHLNETELIQFNTWSTKLSRYYIESDVLHLHKIACKALTNGYLDENDIYELLDILPRIILDAKAEVVDQPAEDVTDWQENMDEQLVKYKREMDKLRQTLSNWIFLQSAVYRKNIKPAESSSGRIYAKANKPGNIKNR